MNNDLLDINAEIESREKDLEEMKFEEENTYLLKGEI